MLEAVSLAAFRAELERARQREQEARAASLVVGRAVAERHGDAEIGLKVVPQEQTDAAASRCQGKAVAQAIAIVPDRACVGKAIELIAAPVAEVDALVEAELERTGQTIVTADLGCTIAAAEGSPTEIELL